jgi:hypothetical protein
MSHEDERKKQATAKEPEAPTAVRTVYGPSARALKAARPTEFKARNSASEIRVKGLIAADRQAHSKMRATEKGVKDAHLDRSMRNPRQGVESPKKSFNNKSQHEKSNEPSSLQVRGGYAGMFTPGTSPIGAGPMGSLSNGLKPMGLTELFNLLLDGGKEAKDVAAERVHKQMEKNIKKWAKDMRAGLIHDSQAKHMPVKQSGPEYGRTFGKTKEVKPAGITKTNAQPAKENPLLRPSQGPSKSSTLAATKSGGGAKLNTQGTGGKSALHGLIAAKQARPRRQERIRG